MLLHEDACGRSGESKESALRATLHKKIFNLYKRVFDFWIYCKRLTNMG